MNRKRITVVVVCLCLVTIANVSADENLRVLPETLDGVAANKIMGHYLRKQAALQFENWKREYENRKTPEQVSEYQKRLHAKFIEVLGGFPDRTPMNPQVTGVVRRDGYHVEKIIFESQPKHYVTAALFLPDAKKHKAPYPGVLVPCGHARNAKAYDSYQRMGALLALNGLVAWIGPSSGVLKRILWLLLAVSCLAVILQLSRYGMECGASTIFSRVRRSIRSASDAQATAAEALKPRT
jgi:hypothetical protein